MIVIVATISVRRIVLGTSMCPARAPTTEISERETSTENMITQISMLTGR